MVCRTPCFRPVESQQCPVYALQRGVTGAPDSRSRPSKQRLPSGSMDTWWHRRENGSIAWRPYNEQNRLL